MDPLNIPRDVDAANAATAIAALLGATPEWEAETLERVADILAQHGYTHPGNATGHEQQAYRVIAKSLGLDV